MIKTVSLTKTFGPTPALENLSTTIESGSIYGLVGSNGAGKSTLLHLLAGIYRPTSGSIEIDGQPVYENSACKQQIFFIPDEIYQQPGASMERQSCTPACIPSGHSSGTNSWCSVSPSTPSASYPPARRGCAAKSPSSSA